jgi:hypothetical protein
MLRRLKSFARRPENSLMLLVAGSIGVFSSCSTPGKMDRLATCLTDPKNNAMHCDGVTKPWADMSGYACHRVEDLEEYLKGCR